MMAAASADMPTDDQLRVLASELVEKYAPKA